MHLQSRFKPIFVLYINVKKWESHIFEPSPDGSDPVCPFSLTIYRQRRGLNIQTGAEPPSGHKLFLWVELTFQPLNSFFQCPQKPRPILLAEGGIIALALPRFAQMGIQITHREHGADILRCEDFS